MLNVLLNIALFTIKFIGGKISCSVSIMSDAFNNLTDAVTTLFAWAGLKVSSIGEGVNHPNGHGRFEWIIALVSSTSVILIGWELFKNSISAIRNPENTVFSVFAFIALLASVGVKLFMYVYNNRKSKINNSSALKAVAVDCLSDAVSTAVVLVSFAVNAVFHVNIDGWCGVLVSLFIVYNGFESFLETSNRIMGHSASLVQLEEMRSFVLENSTFKEIRDLQIEDYGFGRYRVSMTAIGNDSCSAEDVLESASDAKYRIYKKYGYTAVISVEKNSAPVTVVQAQIEQIVQSMEIVSKVASIRFNKVGNNTIVYIEIEASYWNDDKKIAYEKELNEKLSDIPENYKLLIHTKLPCNPEHHRRFVKEIKEAAKRSK